jgi:hypothetical protein
MIKGFQCEHADIQQAKEYCSQNLLNVDGTCHILEEQVGIYPCCHQTKIPYCSNMLQFQSTFLYM